MLRTDGGAVGLGAATPEANVTGETAAACGQALDAAALSWLEGGDVRRVGAHCEEARRRMAATPGALAAVDMALHDLFARDLGVPLADALGRVHEGFPTSVTLGIQNEREALALAEELVAAGFTILKVKTGESLRQDVELVRRLSERFGPSVKLRCDANAGYSVAEAVAFLEQTEDLAVEFLEQPVPAGDDGLRRMPDRWRDAVAADESLLDERDALSLAAPPRACGVFNIKLMKCGGIRPALRIASLADAAGIGVMWGCMDESVIGIAAALHAALAAPATRYLDLDGSFDLARDVAEGGFAVRNGELTLSGEPGLGVRLVGE